MNASTKRTADVISGVILIAFIMILVIAFRRGVMVDSAVTSFSILLLLPVAFLLWKARMPIIRALAIAVLVHLFLSYSLTLLRTVFIGTSVKNEVLAETEDVWKKRSLFAFGKPFGFDEERYLVVHYDDSRIFAEQVTLVFLGRANGRWKVKRTSVICSRIRNEGKVTYPLLYL